MKNFLALFLLAVACHSAHAQTDTERAFIKSIEDTLNCYNSVGCTSVIVLFNQDKQVAMRGQFSQWKLICGIQCVYDPEQHLQSVKIFRDGNLIGEAIMPE